MLAFLRLKEGSVGVRRADLPALLAAAFFGITLNQICFVIGVANTTASDTALLLGTAPIFTAVLAATLGLERVGVRGWISVAIGMAGVVLIVEGAAAPAAGQQSLLGDALALGTAATWAVYTLLVRPLMRRYSAYRLSTFMMVAGTAMLWPIALPSVLRQDFGVIEPAAWAAVAYSTLFAVVVTNVLYFTAIHRLGSARASVFLYLESFGGVLFAAILLGERVTLVQIAGGLIVTAAVVASRGRQKPGGPPAQGEEIEVVEPVV
jgi:drug/metabolite transporter (DMT)-like permease